MTQKILNGDGALERHPLDLSVPLHRDLEAGEIGQIFLDRIAEQEAPFLPQHHGGHRSDGLGHGIDEENRSRGHRRSAGGISQAKTVEKPHPAAPRDQCDGAGETPAFDLAAHHRAQAGEPIRRETDFLGCGERKNPSHQDTCSSVGSSVNESRSKSHSKVRGSRPSLYPYDTQTTGMPAARAACTSFTESPIIKASDGRTCSDSHAKNSGCGSGLRRTQVSPPTTTSTQAPRPSRRSSAAAKRCCLLVTTAVRSPASCKARSDSAAPAYGRALSSSDSSSRP